ncbi:hypothetical protein L9F63_005240, partial [Diploptera punctata]
VWFMIEDLHQKQLHDNTNPTFLFEGLQSANSCFLSNIVKFQEKYKIILYHLRYEIYLNSSKVISRLFIFDSAMKWSLAYHLAAGLTFTLIITNNYS